MKLHWLKFVLLATFAFWATGAAKYTHELIEHHGHDASVVDDDDNSDFATNASAPVNPQDPSHPPIKHACPICQMLAGMAVQQDAPPAVPTNYFPLIATLIIADHIAPTVHPAFDHSARGPPAFL